MTEAYPTVKQYHAVHRMLNGFTSYMKMKMHENMHKGTWEECTYEYLRNRITEELKEFDLAIAEERYDDARLEAADVGNFFGMISDNIAYGRFKNYNCASHSSAKSNAKSDAVLDERLVQFHSELKGLSEIELIEEQKELTEGLKEALETLYRWFPELRQQKERE